MRCSGGELRYPDNVFCDELLLFGIFLSFFFALLFFIGI